MVNVLKIRQFYRGRGRRRGRISDGKRPCAVGKYRDGVFPTWLRVLSPHMSLAPPLVEIMGFRFTPTPTPTKVTDFQVNVRWR